MPFPWLTVLAAFSILQFIVIQYLLHNHTSTHSSAAAAQNQNPSFPHNLHAEPTFAALPQMLRQRMVPAAPLTVPSSTFKPRASSASSSKTTAPDASALERRTPVLENIPSSALCPKLVMVFRPKARVYLAKFKIGGSWPRMYVFDNVMVDSAKVNVSRGGEDPKEVRTSGRKTALEYPKYAPGAWTLPFAPKLSPRHLRCCRGFIDDIIVSSRVGNPGPGECTRLPGTTAVFLRHEYVNLFHTFFDWFQLHLTMLQRPGDLPRGQFNLLFLDGHARGSLDEVWERVFTPRVYRLGQLEGRTCFDRVVSVPKISALWMTKLSTADTSGCRRTLQSFTDAVLGVYGVERYAKAAERWETIIERAPYDAHPHADAKKISRILVNMDDVRRARPAAAVVQLEAMSFREQLHQMANTHVLRGMHGAGLTWLVFLPVGAVVEEWIPVQMRDVRLFEFLQTWVRVDYHGLPVTPKDDDIKSDFHSIDVTKLAPVHQRLAPAWPNRTVVRYREALMAERISARDLPLPLTPAAESQQQRCATCRSGVLASGGAPLGEDGVCRLWCSRIGDCGWKLRHKEGGVDCTGAAGGGG